MEYNHKEIESRWQQYWKDNKIYKAEIDKNRPKFYVLDMFPYPSGAGLHVGHPLGYIASDIFHAINACRDSMCFILWDMMPTDFPLSSMPYRPGNIPKLQHDRI